MRRLWLRGIDVYRNKGVISLFKEVTRYGFDRLLLQASTLRLVDDVCFRLSVRRLRRRIDEEEGLEDILETAFYYRGYGRYRSIKPFQIREEFEELVSLVSEREPTTVMEIGTAKGGTLYTWCRYLDSASLILSIDLPGGEFGGGYAREMTRFFEEFAPDKELVFIRDNSHAERTAQVVTDTVVNSGIDFLWIDGDHRYEGVKKDFEMYAPLVSNNGLIAFHDIVPGPEANVGGVPEFWRELKMEYETYEIVSDMARQTGFGIGLLTL